MGTSKNLRDRFRLMPFGSENRRKSAKDDDIPLVFRLRNPQALFGQQVLEAPCIATLVCAFSFAHMEFFERKV